MKLIVALGNPGTKYEHTRHNAGWLVLDWQIQDLGLKIKGFKQEKNFHSEILASGQILYIKPQTFMNESGSAVKAICDFYKIEITKDLLIIHDEVDIPLGAVRSTGSSSAAGHNGIKDIIEKLGTQDFHRLRIGVESRASKEALPTDAFVLQKFSPEELKKLQEEIFPKVKAEVEKFLGPK